METQTEQIKVCGTLLVAGPHERLGHSDSFYSHR